MADNYYDPVRGFQFGTPPKGGQRGSIPFRSPDQDGPAPPVGPPPNTTALSPEEQMAFAAWRATLPKELQSDGDYDLQGFFKANPGFTATQGDHMTDKFKKPNHPTFSDESQYYAPSTARLGGHWEGDVFVPNDEAFKSRVDETPPAPKKRRQGRRAVP